MIKKIVLVCVFFWVFSCGNIELMLKDQNTPSILKNNTSIVFEGNSEPIFVEEVLLFFGNTKETQYTLITSFSEKKENMFVKKNQVAEKIDYELSVNYRIYENIQGCEVFNEEIITSFSFVPKSFGYNFGTDRSLEQLYKRSVRKNIQNFIFLSPKNKSSNCL